MDTLETLTARLETTEDIRAIVRTMKSLSAVSITQYERAVVALRDYQRTVDLGLQALLRDGVPRESPRAGTMARATVIVVGSDHGLCGRFNETVADWASRALLGGPTPPRLLAAGLRGAARLDALGHAPDAMLELPGAVEGLTRTAHEILLRIDAWRGAQELGALHVCYNRRTETARAVPYIARAAPLSRDFLTALADAPWPGHSLPMITMDRGALFSWLIRQRLFLEIYRALAESLASEHAQRLAAMQAADRNISDRREALVAQVRQKRQQQITTELLDIVSGFEAARSSESVTDTPEQPPRDA